jgi:hypothetical protein
MPRLPYAGRQTWRSILKSLVHRNAIPHRRLPFGRIEMLEDRSVPATFNVNTFLDTAAANLSLGIDSSGNTSLRSALQAINNQGGSHRVEVPSGTYLISQALGDLLVNGSPAKAQVEIVGAGRDTTFIDGQNATRVLRVFTGNSLSVSALTVQHGRASVSGNVYGRGGGVYAQGTFTATNSAFLENSVPDDGFGGGGAIAAEGGTVTVSRCTFTGNSAEGSSDGGAVRIGSLGLLNNGTISDSTFTGNSANLGGAICHDGQILTMTDTVISNNTSRGGGGGIGNRAGDVLNLARCTITDNQASFGNTLVGVGGGVLNSSGIVTIDDSLIARNSSDAGGGIFSGGAQLSVRRTILDSNTASSSSSGGAIDSGGPLTMIACVISNNFASSGGGLRLLGSDPVTIADSTFFGNDANTGGGIWTSADLTLANCTFASNTSTSVGGAIYNKGVLTVVASTFTQNSGTRGGAIYDGDASTGSLVLINSILAGNTASSMGPDVFATITAGSNNIVGNGANLSGITDGDANGNRVGVDPLLNALADNGGPTQTTSLQAGSPAIGNGGAITMVTTPATASAAAIVVADATAIARTPGSYFIRIGGEEIEVTSVDVSTNTLTVVRGSGAAAIAAGAEVHMARDQRGVPRSLPTSIGAFQAAVVGAPNAPDLLDAFDSGVSNADDLTNLDNSGPSRPLQFQVSGTVAGATVALFANGTEIGSAVASGSSVVVTTNGTFDLVDGTHAITARQTLPGESPSADSAALSLTIDSAAPGTPAALDLDSASDTGASPTDNLTRATTLSFAVSAAPFHRVFRGGALITGSFESAASFTATNQPTGASDYTVAAVDAAGNVSSPSSALQVTIDITPPAVSAPDLDTASDTGSSSMDNITSDTTPTFIGTAEAGASITLLFGSTVIGSANATGGTWSITSTTFAEGTFDVFARATDAAGNTTDSATVGVTIQVNGPAVSAPDLTQGSDTGSSSTDNVTRDTTPTFTGAAGTDANITLLVGSTVLGTATATGGTWTITTAALADGAYNVFARATDAAGNTAESSIVPVTIDTAGPTSTVTRAPGQAASASESSPGFTVQFAVNFSQAITGLSASDLALGGTAGGTITNITGSGSSYTVTVGNLTQPGTVLASVNAGAGTDLAGNAGTASPPGEQVGVTFTTQTIVEVTPATILTGESATITANVNAPAGGAAPGGSILFALTGTSGTINRTINLAGGSASTTFTSLAVGNHTVTATYQPAAGFVTSNGIDAFAVTDPVVVIPVDQNAIGQYAGVAGRTVTVFDADGDVRRTFSPFTATEAPGGVRVAVADVNGDGTPDVIAVTGPGPAAVLRAFDGKSNGLLYEKQLYTGMNGEPFTGGAFVAAGDLNGDGHADLAVTPDEGGGPRVLLFDGPSGSELASFFAIDDPSFRGGARATIGDLNNDDANDLLVSAGFGGGPRVAGFSGATLLTTRTKLFNDFFVFEEQLRNGAYVTIGDLNGDGFGDIIGGGGPGGAPRVLAIDGKAMVQNGSFNPLVNFFAGDANLRGGVRVAAKDFNGDGRTDLITGSGNTGWLYGYNGVDLMSGDIGPSRDERLGGFFNPRDGIYVG